MSMKLYRSYVFRTKDPAIDALRTVIQEEYGQKITWKVMKKIEMDGGPSITSMHNWFFGKTRRPQNAALEAAGRALGYERVWVKSKKEK